MSNNLGIYNRQVYNDFNGFDEFNKHIEQGIQFKNYGKKNHLENEHKLLEESSAPQWGSIIEALTSYDSTQQSAPASTSQISADQANLNKLVSEYSTLYNTYTSTMINKAPTDAARKVMEKSLTDKQAALVVAVNKMNERLLAGAGASSNNNTTLLTNQDKLNSNLVELTEQQKAMAAVNIKYDQATIAGANETTNLHMTSMYYHYLVYFIISVTLIAFTFNILTNPEANVMNAIIVVSAIILIYLIARHYMVPL